MGRDLHERLAHILRYALLVVACVTACYIRPIWRAVKAKLTKRKGEVEKT